MQNYIEDILRGKDINSVIHDAICVDNELNEYYSSPMIKATIVSGLAAVYDLIRSRGLKAAQESVIDSIQNGKKVKSKEFVKKIDPKIKVMTTRAEINAALSQEPKISDFERKIITDMIVNSISEGNNAFAMPGDRGMYVFVPALCTADVLAHEVGHIIDFKNKGITISNWKEYDTGLGIAVNLWKPSYEKHIMAAEKEAWRLAPGQITAERKKLEKAALDTYDKNFHIERAKLSGTVALMHLISDMAARFVGRFPNLLGIRKAARNNHSLRAHHGHK